MWLSPSLLVAIRVFRKTRCKVVSLCCCQVIWSNPNAVGTEPAQRLVACRYGAGRPMVAALVCQELGSIMDTKHRSNMQVHRLE